MNKPYGTQGEIVGFPFRDLQETFYNKNGVEIATSDGILYVGVDDRNDLEQAKQLAQLYLSSWSVRQNMRVKVKFGHTWETNDQGIQNHSLTLEDKGTGIDRFQTHVTTHVLQVGVDAFLVTHQMGDSASFTNDDTVVQKSQRYPALRSALIYYSQEIVDDERPLYGVYKALEAIIDYLDPKEKAGRAKLAALAGQGFSYVDDVMQTTQVIRHHKTAGSRKLSDKECRHRAKVLIEAFADSLP